MAIDVDTLIAIFEKLMEPNNRDQDPGRGEVEMQSYRDLNPRQFTNPQNGIEAAENFLYGAVNSNISAYSLFSMIDERMHESVRQILNLLRHG